jgi:hypothetical protein
VSAIVETRPAPAVELRTSLGLAALAAALIHLMSAVHGGAVVAELAAAGILAALAAVLAFTGTRDVLGPAIGFTIVLTIGLPSLLAVPAQLVVAGGALALSWRSGDRACARLSRLAFAVFALAAMTGFGHLTH